MDATITVTGNVGSDIDLRTDNTNEWAYAAFRLASTPRLLRGGSWRDGETTWLNVNCRNRALSLNVHGSLAKGDPVLVTGRLTTWSWTNKETGEIREKVVLEAISVGHDLCRGTSVFQKAERVQAEPPAGDDPDVFDGLEQGSETPAGNDAESRAESDADPATIASKRAA